MLQCKVKLKINTYKLYPSVKNVQTYGETRNKHLKAISKENIETKTCNLFPSVKNVPKKDVLLIKHLYLSVKKVLLQGMKNKPNFYTK